MNRIDKPCDKCGCSPLDDYYNRLRLIKDNKEEKKLDPTHWFTVNGEINYDKLHEFAESYKDNIAWNNQKQDIIRMLEDMDAGMCTMNGDTHTTEVSVMILSIL